MFQTIFKAGKYPQGVFTNEHIAEIAAAYDPVNIHEACLIVGHNDFKEEKKALAWVKELKAQDGDLLADFGEVSPELYKTISRKEFKRCSVELGKIKLTDLNGADKEQWYLYAVALTNMPAVGNLPPLEFSEKRNFAAGKFEGQRVTFSQSTQLIFSHKPNPNKMFAKLILVAAKFGIDTSAFTEESAESLIATMEVKFTDINQKLTASQTKCAQLEEESKKFSQQRADDLIASAVSAGKVKPADADKFKAFALADYEAAKVMFNSFPVNQALAPETTPAAPAATGSDKVDEKFTHEGKPLSYDKFLELFKQDPKIAEKFSAEDIQKIKLIK